MGRDPTIARRCTSISSSIRSTPTWPQVRDLAVAAEERGWAGVWTWDHLSGVDPPAGPRARGLDAAVGPGGGHLPRRARPAGAQPGEPGRRRWWPRWRPRSRRCPAGGCSSASEPGPARPARTPPEQFAVGHQPGHDPERRAALVEYVGVLRQAWAGSLGGAGWVPAARPDAAGDRGRLRPEAGAVAGQVADGMNTHAALPGLEELVESGPSGRPRTPTGSWSRSSPASGPAWLDPDSHRAPPPRRRRRRPPDAGRPPGPRSRRRCRSSGTEPAPRRRQMRGGNGAAPNRGDPPCDRRSRLLLPLLVVAALAAACGGDDGDVEAGEPGDATTTTVDPDTAVSSPRATTDPTTTDRDLGPHRADRRPRRPGAWPRPTSSCPIPRTRTRCSSTSTAASRTATAPGPRPSSSRRPRAHHPGDRRSARRRRPGLHRDRRGPGAGRHPRRPGRRSRARSRRA